MTDIAMLAPEPFPDPDSEGFWAATADGHLAISRCQECGVYQHPPHERCRDCGGPVAFEEVSGRGTIYSFIVVRQALVPGNPVPYVIVQVEIEEQPSVRVVGVIAGSEPEAVTIGSAVQVHFADPGSGGFRSPQWTLA
jgi:uncharacterized OB-fold protein